MRYRNSPDPFIGVMITVLILFCVCCMFYPAYMFYATGYASTVTTDTYKCVKTYTVINGKSTSKRVDLEHDGVITTMECDDSLYYGVYDSAHLYSQFEPGKSYKIRANGVRYSSYAISFFPLIVQVDPE